MVDTHSRRSYKGMKTYLSTDGTMGVAITQDGDIVSVFSRSKSKGAVNKLISFAVANGGRKLDAYAGGLETMYGRLGAKAHARVAFDDRYKPKGWNGKRYDVVAMSLPKTLNGVVNAYRNDGKLDITEVPYASDYDSMLAVRDREMGNSRLGVGLRGGTKPNANSNIVT